MEAGLVKKNHKHPKAIKLMQQGLTQDELCGYLGWSRMKLNLYFRGKVHKFTERELYVLKSFDLCD
jgi:transcriptional regulator with XRE-family HTH domain